MNLSTLTTLGAAGLAVGLLAGCASDVEQAEGMAPHGTAFDNRLYAGYLELAQNEEAEYDERDANAFSGRAMTAAKGDTVDPEEISARDLPKDKVGELTAARGRLMAALSKGARTSAAGDAAQAQVAFDCWMQEQEENIQPNDIENCRKGFMAAMDRVDARLAPRPVAAAPAPAPMAAAAPAKPESQTFLVFFNYNSRQLTPEGRRVVQAAAAELRKRPDATVVLTGHTDSVGSVPYNLGLSLRRAEAVEAMIDAAKEPSQTVEVLARGESEPLVPTPDNVREAQNRRVEITIK